MQRDVAVLQSQYIYAALIMHGHTSASHTLYVVIIMVIYKCIAQEPVRSIHAAAHYAGLVWS